MAINLLMDKDKPKMQKFHPGCFFVIISLIVSYPSPHKKKKSLSQFLLYLLQIFAIIKKAFLLASMLLIGLSGTNADDLIAHSACKKTCP